MRLGAVVSSVATVRLVAVLVEATVGVDHAVGAITFVVGLAGIALGLLWLAVHARIGLGTNTDEVANLDVTLGLVTDTDGNTDDLVADNARVGSRALV